MVRTPKTPPLLLPPGLLDIVEVGAGAFHHNAILNIADDADEESLPVAAEIASPLEEEYRR